MALQTSGPLLGFRIADDRYPLLDGGGAFLVGGRWHSPGRYVIYAGLGFAVALVEMLVHTRVGRVPEGQQFAEIFIPGVVRVEQIGADDVSGWDRPDYVASQAYGDAWYDSGRSAVLIVPSVPALGLERNLLINQRHEQFRHIAQGDPRPLIWDARLFAAP